jgi:hypothetical protein
MNKSNNRLLAERARAFYRIYRKNNENKLKLCFPEHRISSMQTCQQSTKPFGMNSYLRRWDMSSLVQNIVALTQRNGVPPRGCHTKNKKNVARPSFVDFNRILLAPFIG